MRNIRLAFRTLFKTPFVTTIAVLSLALGIGTNTAIFSIVDQMLLSALPVRDPGELVNLANPGPKPGSQSCGQAGDCDVVFSYPMFRDLEKEQTVLTGLAAHMLFGANLAYGDQTTSGRGVYVSGSYFPVLGIRPQLGRLLSPDDDQVIGAGFVTVLSSAYWKTHLGADPSVIGKTITINGVTFTIAGVAPDGFSGTTLGANPAVYVPMTMRDKVQHNQLSDSTFINRRSYSWYLFGRLKRGVSAAQAKTALNALYRPILNDVEAPLQKQMSEATMVKFKAKELMVTGEPRGQSSLHEETRTPLTMLFAITAIVLLIACANIANLLLARGAGRSMEMAVRLSLGGSRRQLLTQLLTESCVLALIGGAASLIVARLTLVGVSRILPTDNAPTISVALEIPVLVFAAVISIATGFLFGLFPALHSTRPDLVTSIRANAGQISGAKSASRFRTSLATGQIALSMALLICAGLFIKSLTNISRVDLGLDVDHLVAFTVSPWRNGYEPARSAVFFDRLLSEIGTLPGVTGAAGASVGVLEGNNWGNDVSVEGFKRDADTEAGSNVNEVGPGYFKTMGIPLLAGREFAAGDGLGAPQVAIVNEAFAKKFGLGKDAVGKRFGRGFTTKYDLEIVGLTKDAKYSEVKKPVPPVFFIPYKQDSFIGGLEFYVRTTLPEDQSVRAIPGVVRRLDPNLPVRELKTVTQQARDNTFMDRMISTMASAFATLATVLAAIGLYGVLAYSVAQRTREIGVRMALGADGAKVRALVLKQVGLMVIIGGVIGIGGALALGRAARTLLYGLEGHDPAVIASATVLLSLVAFAAGFLPALRASRVSPMQALRYE
jgi:predicted permease